MNHPKFTFDVEVWPARSDAVYPRYTHGYRWFPVKDLATYAGDYHNTLITEQYALELVRRYSARMSPALWYIQLTRREWGDFSDKSCTKLWGNGLTDMGALQ